MKPQSDPEVSRDEVLAAERQKSEYVFDLSSIPQPGECRLIQRGIIVSCEGAGHPHHQHAIKRDNPLHPSNNR